MGNFCGNFNAQNAGKIFDFARNLLPSNDTSNNNNSKSRRCSEDAAKLQPKKATTAAAQRRVMQDQDTRPRPETSYKVMARRLRHSWALGAES